MINYTLDDDANFDPANDDAANNEEQLQCAMTTP
jgi:hypothetical protein